MITYSSVSDYVERFPFEKPIHRLIMMLILNAGDRRHADERVIDNEVIREFCCCTSQMLFKEVKALERAGLLRVRKIGFLTIDVKTRLEAKRGYTMIMPRGL
ncbi:transcriptional regulator [Serratia fonticola]|uniref:transcriptional regulator n=1 Tax=Serratia fonticola TaxID=47917 RepID=UPI0027E83334|nr:transcriptional regulator [Serratia fonticola]MDQ7208491.1 transcriptional regulator [Serratia fonticola]HBE9078596.1 transcriptional regulator [Serratia fonticola]HBE9151688.1 transcriptional regulator [Serratia fonticola]